MATQQADPADVGPIPVARTVLGALRCLARTGAYAVLRGEMGAAEGEYAVHAGAPAARALALLPAGVVAQARGRGWLATDAEGRLCIGAAGLKALRRASVSDKGSGRTGEPRKALAVASARASHESPLAWLRRRKDKDGQPLITQAQYDAGERLAADFHAAQISRRVTSDWSGAPAAGRTRRAAPGAGIDISDIVAAARKRIDRALSAVGSGELANILIDVCCFETGLEAAERAKRWPQRSAKLILQIALTALARHYGLIAPDLPPIARLRHWGDADYRPGIDAWRERS